MTTHEIEEMLGITKQALIYYEKEGMIKPKRDNNNYRNYSQEDIDVLRLILLLRSMEVSIDDIQLIMNNELSIRQALEIKREYIENSKIKLECIDEKIKNYIKRRKVKVSFDNEIIKEWKGYDTLYLNKDNIQYNEIVIDLRLIKDIDISMYSSMAKGRAGYGLGTVFFQYFVDIDIHTKRDTYSFSILNNKRVKEMFDYFLEKQLDINDPLQLIQLYHEKTDEVELNNYINTHFKEWAKTYHLDNPRDDFTYYSPIRQKQNTENKKNDFFGLNVLKQMFKKDE